MSEYRAGAITNHCYYDAQVVQIVNMCAIAAAKTIKNTDTDASILKRNCCNWIIKIQQQQLQNTAQKVTVRAEQLLTLSRGGRGGGACPRILCTCYMLQYDQTI